jgi:hypothetical protein
LVLSHAENKAIMPPVRRWPSKIGTIPLLKRLTQCDMWGTHLLTGILRRQEKSVECSPEIRAMPLEGSRLGLSSSNSFTPVEGVGAVVAAISGMLEEAPQLGSRAPVEKEVRFDRICG